MEEQTPVTESVDNPKTEGEKRSVWNTISLIASRALLVVSIIVVIFTVFSTIMFNKDDREIFGVKMYVVLSDSMKKTDFAAGDLILVKEVDPKTLKEGDIITFVSQNEKSLGETITHKIREKTTTKDGDPGFITYGTTSDENDKAVVTYEWIKGQYVGKIPWLGWVFSFLKTIPGYIVCILLPFGALIAYQGVHCWKYFKAYRGEKTDEYRIERERLAKEREETQRMLEEMRALKKALDEQKQNGSQTEQNSEQAE